MKRRFLSVILVLAMIFSFVTSVTAAESYGEIILEVPRVTMDSWTSACYIASFASVEAYIRGSFGGVLYEWGKDYTWETPIWKYSLDDWGAPHFGDGKVGAWTRISSSWHETKDYSLENLYSILAGGRPVVVYRSNGHASVLMGYNGRSGALVKKNFVVMEVVKSSKGWCVQDITAIKTAADRGYTNQNCCYVNLEAWLEGGTIIRAFYPDASKPITPAEPIKIITLTGWNYPVNKQSGKTYELLGTIESPNPLKYASVSVHKGDAEDAVFSAGVDYSENTSPVNYFDIRSVDRDMPFDSLANGTYYYRVDAVDDKGYRILMEKQFTVSSSSTTDDSVSKYEGEHDHDAIPEYSWDTGVVTTEPTETDEGVKTYTCFCGTTKTEVLPKIEVEVLPTVQIENLTTDAMAYNITFDITVSEGGYSAIGYLIGSSADRMHEVYLEADGKCTVHVNAEETYGILDGGHHFIIAFADYNGVRCTSDITEAELPIAPAPMLHGDTNCDGKVNLSDVSLLLKYVAKWSVTVDTYYADVNRDGKVNLSDASKMMKYIAKWDNIVLG